MATIFNFGDIARSLPVSLADLGLDVTGLYNVFDFWKSRLLGVAAGTILVSVPPNGCRTLLIRRFQGRPQILGGDWHIAAERISNVSSVWDEGKMTLKGSVVADPERAISLFVSPFGIGKRYAKASVSSDKGTAAIHENVGAWRLEIRHDKAESVRFSITFGESMPLDESDKVEVATVATTAWVAAFSIKRKPADIGGVYLIRNGAMLGYCPDGDVLDEDVEPLADYTYEVIPVDYSGAPRSGSIVTLRPSWPNDTAMMSVPIWSYHPEDVPPLRGRSLRGGPLAVGGRQLPGLGVASPGGVLYGLYRAFSWFEGFCAMTDDSDGSTTFVVLGDGVELWRSKPLRAGGSEPFKLDVSGVFLLELRAEGSADGAAWVNPVLRAKPRP